MLRTVRVDFGGEGSGIQWRVSQSTKDSGEGGENIWGSVLGREIQDK